MSCVRGFNSTIGMLLWCVLSAAAIDFDKFLMPNYCKVHLVVDGMQSCCDGILSSLQGPLKTSGTHMFAHVNMYETC